MKIHLSILILAFLVPTITRCQDWGFVAVPSDGEFYEMLNDFFRKPSDSVFDNSAYNYGPHVTLSGLIDARHVRSEDSKLDFDFLTDTLRSAIESRNFVVEDVRYVQGYWCDKFVLTSSFFNDVRDEFSKTVPHVKTGELHLTIVNDTHEKPEEHLVKIRKEIREKFLVEDWHAKFKAMHWKLLIYQKWNYPKLGQVGKPIRIAFSSIWTLLPGRPAQIEQPQQEYVTIQTLVSGEFENWFLDFNNSATKNYWRDFTTASNVELVKQKSDGAVWKLTKKNNGVTIQATYGEFKEWYLDFKNSAQKMKWRYYTTSKNLELVKEESNGALWQLSQTAQGTIIQASFGRFENWYLDFDSSFHAKKGIHYHWASNLELVWPNSPGAFWKLLLL